MPDSKRIIYGARCKHGRLHGLLAAGIASAREDAKTLAEWVRDGSTIEQLPSAGDGSKEWRNHFGGCEECSAERVARKSRKARKG